MNWKNIIYRVSDDEHVNLYDFSLNYLQFALKIQTYNRQYSFEFYG